MGKQTTNLLVSVFRASRLILHLVYGLIHAAIYPHLRQTGQLRIVKSWSTQLLAILNIGIQIEGQQLARGESGCMLVANHISWLDIFVLNAIHPSRFIAKSEVRDWPIIGWISRRSGTIYLERAMRQDASSVNRRIGALLRQGMCIGLFPEGTTTEGKQVGHFHSALIQPAIDSGVKLCPIALRYTNDVEETSSTIPFTGDTTIVRSIWQIVRCRRHKALMVFTPALHTQHTNRRILARAAQSAIARELQTLETARKAAPHEAAPDMTQPLISPQSAYALLVDPLLNPFPK